MKSVKLNNMYELYEDGTLVKISNGKEITRSVKKTKNYIQFEFQLKINNKKCYPKLHKLMMAHFGLTKSDCLEKGFLYHYDEELYQSLLKGDNALNRKLTDDEKYYEWCVKFLDKYDLVNNPNRSDELYYHANTYKAKVCKEWNPLFVPYAPDINRYKEMVDKLLREKDRARYYFLVFRKNKGYSSHSYIQDCLARGIEIEEEYQYAVDYYLKQKEKSREIYAEQERRKEEERIKAEQELQYNLALAHNDEQFERCNDAIKICSAYVDSLETFIEMALKNNFIEQEDVEYIMNNEVLINKLKSYRLHSTTRNEKATYSKDEYYYEDIKSYSDDIDRYYSKEENKMKEL